MNKFVIFTAFAVLCVSFCTGDKTKHAKAHIFRAGGKHDINGKDYLGTVEFFEVGDDKNQVATISITDNVITLNGPLSIVKHSIVIHEKADDLGKGSTEASKKTGDSGSRVACGLIEIPETNSGITAKFFAIQLWINFAILILFTKFLY